MVRHLDVLVASKFNRRDHFELGLEAQRLAIVEVDIGNVGPADDIQVLRVDLLLQVLGNQAFHHLFPNFACELLSNQ
jgi:hypothetical protein